MSYDTIAHVVKLGGTVSFFAVFLVVIVYALWPKNKALFEHAAQIPLDDNDAPEV